MRNIVLDKMLIFVVISSFLTVYLQFTKQVRTHHQALHCFQVQTFPHCLVTATSYFRDSRTTVTADKAFCNMPLKSKNPATNMSTRDK